MVSQTESEAPTVEELRDAEIYARNKNMAAFWLLFLTQILYSFMYGFFIKTASSGT